MYTIKSIGVLSTAKLMGLCYFAFGLLLSPIFLLLGLVQQIAGTREPAGAIAGVAVAVMLPFFYGVIGFISGAVGAFIYNLFANWVGGIEIELKPPAATALAASTAGAPAL
jgi:hypothetical protein